MRLRSLSVLVAVALGGCAAVSAHEGQVVPRGARYVAMGSSYAAGAGIGPRQAGSPVRCDRDVNNYASLVAVRLGLNLVDVSCGGATTDHILGPWNELPAQIEAVDNDTRLVTITIGGNDLGFVGWLFAGSCRRGVSLYPGPCRPAHEPAEADYEKLGRNMRAIAAQVHARAPRARVVFVQYLSVVSSANCPLEAISPEDGAVAKRVAKRLASVTARAAQDSGAEVLATDALSLDHTPCSKEPWSNGLSASYTRAQGAPWHPNAAGHAAVARALAQRLRPGGA